MKFWNWLKSLFKKPAVIAVEKQKDSVNDTPVKTGEGSNWYPSAIRYHKMKTHGEYSTGYPKGAVVHFTAGRSENGLTDAKGIIDYGIQMGFAYLAIAKDGQVVQAHPINEWGYHAGESKWKGLFGSVSDDLIGIEICNAGKVEKIDSNKFKTWFGTYLDASQVRYVTESDYGCPTGYYQKYTIEQENALINLLVWLKKNDKTGSFKIDYILGHIS